MDSDDDLAALVAALGSGRAKVKRVEVNGQREEPKLRCDQEAAVATLREVLAAFQGGCQYKVGDFVTPRKGAGYRAAGLPHIVAQVFTPSLQTFKGNPASARYARRIDMRVFTIYDDDVTAFAVESWAFVPWEAAGEG